MADEQYFTDSPGAASDPRMVTLALPDGYSELHTDAGVFSASRIDAGTKYLLTETPTPDPAPSAALDLGCGYGPIATTLARRCPTTQVWAIDVNERARALCAKNAADLGLANVNVAGPDELDSPDHVSLRFDLIWSNPPIRVGKPALHALLERWLDRLAPTGHAVLVVQKHLGSDSLQSWLSEQGWATDRISSRMGYRLLRVGARR